MKLPFQFVFETVDRRAARVLGTFVLGEKQAEREKHAGVAEGGALKMWRRVTYLENHVCLTRK